MSFLKNKVNLSVIAFFVFLVVGLAVYANSFGNKFFWDDDDLIVNNIFVHDFSVGKFFTENEIAGVGQTSNYWRPLTLISLAVDYKLWDGSHPLGFHLTNTLLHILAAWLAFILLYKLLSLPRFARSDNRNFWLSFLPAFLFLIHPLQTEAVTYTAGRADPLSAVCLLSSLWFYVTFRLNGKWWRYAAALSFFILGLLRKEQSILLPALVVLVEAVFLAENYKKDAILKALKYAAPFMIIAAVYLLLRLTLLNFNDILSGPEYGLDQAYSQSAWSRLFTFCLVMLSYFKLLFVPTGLHMAREVEPVLNFFSWPVISFLVLAAGLFFLGVKTWKADRLVSFGLLWFFVILLPRTNILKINRPMYEHWLYLPMIGFWLAFFSLLFFGYGFLKEGRLKRIIKISSLSLFVAFCCLLLFLTAKRNTDWKDPITFYEKNLKYTPNSYIQVSNLAMAYANAGRHKEAIGQYRRSLALADIYPQVRYNLGNSLAVIGQTDQAVAEYRRAIEISPGFFQAYVNLINVFSSRSQKDEAIKVFNEAEPAFAGSSDFWYFKGVVYFQWKEYTEALAFMRRAQEISPKDEVIKKAITSISSKISK